ncbi:haloacid dehalogenase-like hydrolase [Chryseobacterium soldanellicola]|uniref:Haloacid dehalogenase-like hydrolase n=1 Tax=Chryseobacterium soldanellicola TaxID=311333 RepID=A0A1H1FDZ8_9FLAO|nr:HAD hydrolase family protein [Chryseobacterium soldanellicola]SDQ99353.1 haloacid dehalogenase-like hydrolase [Chryseobacterium soldanellicola]
MGKPYSEELLRINNTYHWALDVEIENLEDYTNVLCEKPLFIIGSGGSSSACALFTLYHQEQGLIASDITPLELQYSKKAVNKNSNVAFISASGKNSDILLAFDTAVSLEPNFIFSLILKKNSPLANKSKKYSISKILDFDNPAGQDGFLATNSLVAYFTLVSRIYNDKPSLSNLIPDNDFIRSVISFTDQLYEEFTIVVLYGGWGKPVAIDLESKFSESGIGNVLLSDYRNFGHGRHNWFDKKKIQSAIVAIISKDEEEIAQKTLDLLPSEIPKLLIKSEEKMGNASLELLVKSFYLVKEVGKTKGIDPGRPGVPPYGSSLYNLKYSKLFRENAGTSAKLKNAVMRKYGNLGFLDDEKSFLLWKDAYERFRKKINSTKFRGIFLDYDGTLCSAEERFVAPRVEIIEKLNFFLSQGIVIGIVTGRGKSVRVELQKFVEKKYWQNLIIGYYNGAQISSLENNSMPIKDNSEPLFHEIEKTLLAEPLVSEYINIDIRQGQVTVIVKDKKESKIVKSVLLDLLYNKFKFRIQILESSHSIDIISANTSKNLIFDYCDEHFGLGFSYLCIGDRGKYPGNDYQLLSNEFSLSVDKVSNDPHSCWNLASKGIKCVEATLEYFNAITPVEKSLFKIKF